MRGDIRTLWLLPEKFVEGRASVEAAKEAGVNRHTSDRLFRLLRAAIYLARPEEPIALGPEDIVEGDEVYITAGLEGGAGGQVLDRPPRRRGLKRRGRGTWESDRVPVFGLLRRNGEVRLFVLPNVRTATIRPIVQQMVRQGAKVYTDNYAIYHFLGPAAGGLSGGRGRLAGDRRGEAIGGGVPGGRLTPVSPVHPFDHPDRFRLPRSRNRACPK